MPTEKPTSPTSPMDEHPLTEDSGRVWEGADMRNQTLFAVYLFCIQSWKAKVTYSSWNHSLRAGNLTWQGKHSISNKCGVGNYSPNERFCQFVARKKNKTLNFPFDHRQNSRLKPTQHQRLLGLEGMWPKAQQISAGTPQKSIEFPQESLKL